jgi:uncharacterized protein YjbI with pentapeptide repeats
MAIQQHIEILRRGLREWNVWRRSEHNFTLRPDLSGVDLQGADLAEGYFREVNLSNANLRGANLVRANLSGAILRSAILTGADLCRAKLMAANCAEADFRQTNLGATNLTNAQVIRAKLVGANFVDANLERARFCESDLSGAQLVSPNLNQADLTDADLRDANLGGGLLVGTTLNGANLSGARVYGASVWDVHDAGTRENGLIITPVSKENGPTITVDRIKVAQFVYLSLNNSEIHDVINTLTGKAALILGRFTQPRLRVLEALAAKLRTLDELPIIFNFDNPVDRTTSETVRILASLSKFVIADLTDPKSSPYECHLTIPDVAVPFFPIIEAGQAEFSMFEALYEYDWLLHGFEYRNWPHLIENLELIREEALSKREYIKRRRRESGHLPTALFTTPRCRTPACRARPSS